MTRLAVLSSLLMLSLAGCPSSPSPCDDNPDSCPHPHDTPDAAPSPCGNHVCDSSETTATCPQDCPAPPPEVCGNNTCAGTETADTCPIDCAASLTVDNRTTTTIYYLYWWKCGTSGPGADHLGANVLAPNYHITFDRVDRGCLNFEADSVNGYFRGLA